MSDEITHACPPDGSGLTPCCGRPPTELPLGHRISSEAPTSCPGRPELPKITAPFTADQVAALNAFQTAGWMHPFTCAWRDTWHEGTEGVLFAREDGWHCPIDVCEYEQNWAHAFMADPDQWPSPLVGQIPVALNSPCRCGEPRVDHADDHHAAACQRCPCDGFQLDWKQQILAPPEPLAPASVPVAADGTLREAIAALAHLYERYADNATIPADQRAVYQSVAGDITDLITPKADT